MVSRARRSDDIIVYINDISQVADVDVADQIIDNVRKRMTNEKPRKLPNIFYEAL